MRSARSRSRSNGAALATWLVMLAISLDAAFVSVALPSLSRTLDITPAQSVWVINAFQIAVTASLLPCSALGGLLSYRRIFLIGIFLFSGASAVCAFAGNLEWLVAGRFLQGIGAACIMGIFGALVREIYPADFLGRALSYNALVAAAAAALGPVLAGLVLTYASFTWLFLIALPLGASAYLIGRHSLPATHDAVSSFDRGSALLSALALGGILFAGSQLARGDVSISVWVVASIGLGAGHCLIRRSQGQEVPLFPIDLLRLPVLRHSYLASTLAFGAAMASLVSLPFYLEQELGVSVGETGALLASWPVGTAVGALAAGRLADRMHTGALGAIGMTILACGLLGMSILHLAIGKIGFGTLLFVCGLGFGLFQTPNNQVMIVASPISRGGAAAGLQAAARLLGQTSGALLAALILKFGTAHPTAIFVCAACLAMGATGLCVRRSTIA